MTALRVGDVFQLRGVGNHFRLVASHPNGDGKAVVFGLTDVENVDFPTCVFEKGDPSFLTKRTAVHYRRTQLLPVAGFDLNGIRLVGRLSESQLLKALNGALKSEDIEERFLSLLPRTEAEAKAFAAKALQT